MNIVTIPCPLCSTECHLKKDKKQKYYYSCEDCQTQHFIRGVKGMRHVDDFLKNKGVSYASIATEETNGEETASQETASETRSEETRSPARSGAFGFII